jgi:glycyl-tRNA synthetase
MLTLYERNGLIFWNQEQIAARNMIVDRLVRVVTANLKSQNRGWDFMQVEAPVLTPMQYINPQYGVDDVYSCQSGAGTVLALRPETTMGSYAFAHHMLQNHSGTKLPLVVWQHGKSFRKEQDQVTKNMRLKEFYQLEFQCIYGLTTANDYSVSLMPAVCKALADFCGPCEVVPSDRTPSYAEWTKDVVKIENQMELASMSLRKDFETKLGQAGKVFEVAIGTDRCLVNFLEK